MMQVQQLPSYPLLRVTKESILQPYGFKGREAHSIPLVPAIADVLYPRQRVLLITPPPGQRKQWSVCMLYKTLESGSNIECNCLLLPPNKLLLCMPSYCLVVTLLTV
jgi:hypothetical protein